MKNLKEIVRNSLTSGKSMKRNERRNVGRQSIHGDVRKLCSKVSKQDSFYYERCKKMLADSRRAEYFNKFNLSTCLCSNVNKNKFYVNL